MDSKNYTKYLHEESYGTNTDNLNKQKLIRPPNILTNTKKAKSHMKIIKRTQENQEINKKTRLQYRRHPELAEGELHQRGRRYLSKKSGRSVRHYRQRDA